MYEGRKPYDNDRPRKSNPSKGLFYKNLYSKSKAPKTRFYAVRRGRKTGVFHSEEEYNDQVKGFKGASSRSFTSLVEAHCWLANGCASIARTTREIIVISDDEDDIVVTGSSLARSTKRKAEWSAGDQRDRKRPTLEPELNKNDAPPRPDSEPVLSPQQAQILQRILDGENFFFTGSAGTGKSVLLRAIIQAFKQREGQRSWDNYDDLLKEGRLDEYVPDRWNLAVTASTGMAGVNVGGTTLHSWAGIGLAKEPVNVLIAKVERSKDCVKRWRTTGALVVDEVSMIDNVLLDKLEQIARCVRCNNKVFGGIQIILSGDFFQLPPVKSPKFAFDSIAWSEMFSAQRDNIKSLTRVFRQKENNFVRILENMRKGLVTDEDTRILKSLDRNVIYPDGVEPVGLYPNKAEVERINNGRLEALPTEKNRYRAVDEPGERVNGSYLTLEEATKVLNKNTIWPESLELKVGAQVMLITNMGDGVLVNGSTGIVVDFKFHDEAVKERITIPTAVHGPSLSSGAWPVVEFAPSKYSGREGAQRLCLPPMTIDCLNSRGEPEATRRQVPLILAWALTIHKSQGQTIERLRVDLRNIFEDGQTYVAISRAVSLDTLEIRNFEKHKVKAHQRVIAWAREYEQRQAELDE